MRFVKRCLAIVAIVAVLLSFNTPFASAYINSEGVEVPDTLTIKVGYFGGPYVDKYTFSLYELQSMNVVEGNYTYINRANNVMIEYARGVKISDILKRAGIDLNSVEKLHFICKDHSGERFLSQSKQYLLNTQRYYFPNLRNNWDFDTGTVTNEQEARKGAVKVDTILALEESMSKLGETPDTSNLSSDKRFRLCFGQADVSTITSFESAKWVYAIEVDLAGTPPKLETNPSINWDEIKVGSTFKLLSPTQEIDTSKLEWYSNNTRVATVKRRSDGKVIVVGKGKAVITATLNGVKVYSYTFDNSDPVPTKPRPTKPSETKAPDDTKPSNTKLSVTKNSNDSLITKTYNQNYKNNKNNSKTKNDTINKKGNDGLEILKSDTKNNNKNKNKKTSEKIENKSASKEIVDLTGYKEIEIPKGASYDAGVQNWRSKDMDDDATELPALNDKSKGGLYAGCLATVAFSMGIILELRKFFTGV